MRRFTSMERENCLRLLNQGLDQKQIAEIYNVHQSRISRLKTRLQTTGNHNYQYGGGNRKIDIRSERALLRIASQNRTKCSRLLNDSFRRQTAIRVCDRAIRKTLNKNNLR